PTDREPPMKKLNFADKHLEKIVIGVGAAAAVAAAWFFVVASPNQVDIDGRAMQPADVPDRLATEAENLRTSLGREVELPPINLPNYTNDFAERVADPVATRFALGPIGAPGSNRGGDLEDLTPFDVPTPPLAYNPVARQGVAVYAPVGENRIDQPVIRLIDAEPDQIDPYDFRYVSVGATFDYGAWRERLAEGNNPIREDWWQDSLDITGVFLERQTLDLRTGEWSEPVRIEPLPDRDAYDTDYRTSALEADTVTDLLNFIREEQEQMRQPEFVSTRYAHQFRDPFGVIRTAEQELDLEDALGDIENATRQIERIDQTIERRGGNANFEIQRDRQMQILMEASMRRNELLGEDLPMPEMGDMPQATGGMDDGFERPQRRNRDFDDMDDMGMGGNARNARNARQPRAPQRSNARPNRDPMRQGFEPSRFGGDFDPMMDGGMGMSRGGMQAEVVIEYDGTVRVWAHDLTVKPGKTYRYRVLVTVRNPLLRKTRVAAEQKPKYFDRLTLGPSEGELDATADPSTEDGQPFWTDPITIDPELHYFLVAGSPPNSARVEVWKVYDGRWRQSEFSIAPGDPIGGTAELTIEEQPITLLMQADDLAVDIVPTAGGGNGLGGNTGSRLIIINPENGQMFSRSTLRDRDAIERVRLRNDNQVNDLLEQNEGGGPMRASRQ
ncbi:MAG: hypothetical protein AAF078_09920, partial [Planctomycetota bacterium]